MNSIAITPELILFGGLASTAAIAAVGVVVLKDAVRSALCLVANFFLLAVAYFALNAEMIGITQIVVYTGAIMVLFLFVIMLLNLGAPNLLQEKNDPKVIPGLTLGIIFFGLIGSQILLPLLAFTAPTSPDDFGGPHPIGRNLFTTYALPFEAVSVLLLVGIVGSILLAKRRI